MAENLNFRRLFRITCIQNLENSLAMPYIPTQGFIFNISLRG
nr:MAG TPA: hypothetical protein [Caudoviricetes sp.]DAS78636.1 MAG TPA: hypothetical protein [Caudoviricetes sp.]